MKIWLFICVFQVEADELEEFMLLEQYADDNASFLSSVSAVNRAVQQKTVSHTVSKI